MRKINLNQALIIIFFICLCVFVVSASFNKPRVLVLQSYYTDYSWTNDVDKGINKILEKKPYTIRRHYMDTKNHPEEDFKVKAGNTARKVIDEWRPDVILAVDDDAQQYAAKYYINDPRMKIVFAGINGEIAPYEYDKADNATGIVERKQLQALKDLYTQICQLQGKTGKIRVISIGDRSGSVLEDEHFIETFNWDPVELVDSFNVNTFDEWKKAVIEAEGRADFLLLTNYRKIARSSDDKKLVPPEEIIDWTMKNSNVPGVGTNGFNVEDGYMMALGVSPYEQGEVAANMAVDIIDKGVSPKDIPVKETQQFIVEIRQSGLQKYNMVVPKIYEAFARATNYYYE
ncbi:MAG: hypothetical protein A4E53_02350 [Pelotomaculum sp. PtaB.Bin104]|nr:MAG: hypothetical protein A4E53_02350 [Pelotomaculum sp. PtaB.Bin104]